MLQKCSWLWIIACLLYLVMPHRMDFQTVYIKLAPTMQTNYKVSWITQDLAGDNRKVTCNWMLLMIVLAIMNCLFTSVLLELCSTFLFLRARRGHCLLMFKRNTINSSHGALIHRLHDQCWGKLCFRLLLSYLLLIWLKVDLFQWFFAWAFHH